MTSRWTLAAFGPGLNSLTVAVLVCSAARAGDGGSSAELQPGDVSADVAAVASDLESLRYVMGRPRNEQRDIEVQGATPREVYFQARTLFRKADRLCFEHTRQRVDEPPSPEGVPSWKDVAQVIQAAEERLQRVKQSLGVKDPAVLVPARRESSSSDVFKSIVQANRQLNLLLETRFTPSDVFEQVTRAVALSSRLLEQFPDTEPLPDAPQYEIGKRPSDVYQRLAHCFERIRRIAAISGAEVLEFNPDPKQIAQAEPSDVYDVASLLVSELAYLHARTSSPPPREVYAAGRKFPSDVYQRAGILERQLDELETRVKRNPRWLENRPNLP